MRLTQRKGDTAVAQALATFTKYGYDVSIPLTESAPYDLIVDTGKGLKKVQVKFASGKEVGLRRVHSNSQGYVVKKPLEDTFDWLYVLSGSGEEFLIPYSLAGRNCINPKQKDILTEVLKQI
ncbi:hypothetical protein BH11PAT3_BH11PAT3_0800 [soil metagenome]